MKYKMSRFHLLVILFFLCGVESTAQKSFKSKQQKYYRYRTAYAEKKNWLNQLGVICSIAKKGGSNFIPKHRKTIELSKIGYIRFSEATRYSFMQYNFINTANVTKDI